MPDQQPSLKDQVVMITGAAQRVGAEIARTLHAQGANILIHYRSSLEAAKALQQELLEQRKDSAHLVQADLGRPDHLDKLAGEAVEKWQRLDALVNNASTFYPTPVGSISMQQWDELLDSNLKGPLFLCQKLIPPLRKQHGCIVNIVDIHAERPLKNHSVYCIAKAGLAMLTKSLARELGPDIRVNAVAPGAILWPQPEPDQATKTRILSKTLLKRQGNPGDIGKAVLYFIRDAAYVTGQILAVDGGRLIRN